MKKCPYCAEKIQNEAIKCRYCGEWFKSRIDNRTGIIREKLAKAVYEKYHMASQGKRTPDNPSMQRWARLAEDLKESYRREADGVLEKLNAVGYDFAQAAGTKPKPVKFSDDEIENMARLGHDRWVTEKLRQGFSYGQQDVPKKTSPLITAWEELTEDIKDFQRRAVLEMKELLTMAGIEIYRSKGG